MRPHRGLEVALLTKRRPPVAPKQVFGCDKDPANPWPLQLQMHGPWLYNGVVPDGADRYRSQWQVHNVPIAYQGYQYHTPLNVYAEDSRTLQPRGVGNCLTYSIAGVALEAHAGRLFFNSRMFASPPGSLGAWDLSWATTVTTLSGFNDLLLHVYAGTKFGTALRVSGGYLQRLDFTVGWVAIAAWPAVPADTHTLRTEFRCLLSNDWCRVHVNGQTHTIDYHTPFSAYDLVTVELVRTQGETGAVVGGVQYGRTIQVSDIAVVSAPANKFVDYPWD